MKIKKNFGNTPFGALSETQGYATETNNFGEAAFGILNKSTIDEDNFTSPDVVKSSKATLFSVGNGSDGVRKNIIELKADGTVYISGIGSYDGTTTDGASTIQDTIQDTNDQVQNVIEELEKVNTSIDSINIEKSQDSDLVYTLRVDGEDRGTINIPKDQFLKDVSYNDVTNELVFTFVTKDTDNKEVRVNLTDLVDIYTAGNGINIDNKQISVKIDGTSDPYITISENGVKVSGIDEEITALNAKDTELNSKIGSNTYEGSNYLTKETNLTDAVIQLDEEIKATNDNLALEHANAEATYAKKTELAGYLPLTGGEITGVISVPRTAFTHESSGMMVDMQSNANDFQIRTTNAGMKSFTFTIQNTPILKLTEGGIYENGTLLEDKYALLTDLPNVATTSTNGLMSSADKTKLDSINLAGIQVVTALPDAPNENTMYIVIPA